MANEMDIAQSAGKGAVSGAMTGAKVGSIVPGLGTAVGAIGGAVIGGVSSGMKANKAAKADQAIQAQDPRELARLAEINRIRKSIGAGTDALTQNQINQARQVGASTQGNIARVTGGDTGATVTGLLRAQRGTQAATNQALAGAQQRLPFFENMGQQLMTRVSQRALEVGLQKRDQAMAEKAAQGKANSANIAGALGALGNLQQLPVAAPAGAVGNFQSGDQTGLTQDGLAPKSSFTEPVEVPGIDTSQSGLISPNFSGGDILGGYNPNGQAPIQIAPQGGNTPVNTGFGNMIGDTGMSSVGDGAGGVFKNLFGADAMPTHGKPNFAANLVSEANPAVQAIGTALKNISNLGNAPL